MVNTVPFLVLGGLVALRGAKAFLSVSVLVILCGGAALWLFGRASYHVGASGLIFGYFGYLVARGWYERSTVAILMALLTLFLYGGLVWGVLPSRSFISWGRPPVRDACGRSGCAVAGVWEITETAIDGPSSREIRWQHVP